MDAADLPVAAQRYLRFMKVPGLPRDRAFCAGFTGRFHMRSPSFHSTNAAHPVTSAPPKRVTGQAGGPAVWTNEP